MVYRGKHNFVLLNLYPYTSGHLMVAPYEHVARLEDAAPETVAEMMLTARRAERHLRAIYRPDGLNLGMNIGKAAGAGIAGHIHMHVLPRWTGDANFMTTVGETRVLPEDLEVTYQKLSHAFARRLMRSVHEKQLERGIDGRILRHAGADSVRRRRGGHGGAVRHRACRAKSCTAGSPTSRSAGAWR